MDQHMYEPGPVDGSLLPDQSRHRSDLVPADFRLRSGMKRYWDVVTETGPPTVVLDGIREAGFLGVYQTGFMRHDSGLISAFVDRWRPETQTFHLRFGEATITLEDVYYILGLRSTGLPVSGDSGQLTDVLLHELLGVQPSSTIISKGGINTKWLVDNFGSCDRLHNFDGDYDADYQTLDEFHVRAHLLLVIGSVFPDSSGNTISGHLLHYVADLTRVSSSGHWFCFPRF